MTLNLLWRRRRRLRHDLAVLLGELSGSENDIISFLETQYTGGVPKRKGICVIANFLRDRLGHWPELTVIVEYDVIKVSSGRMTLTQSIEGSALKDIIKRFDNGQLPQFEITVIPFEQPSADTGCSLADDQFVLAA